MKGCRMTSSNIALLKYLLSLFFAHLSLALAYGGIWLKIGVPHHSTEGTQVKIIIFGKCHS
jgi:hypothetical protein